MARLYPLTDSAGHRYTTTPLHAPGVTENGPTGQPWRGMDTPAGSSLALCAGQSWTIWTPPGWLNGVPTGNPRKIRYARDPVTGNTTGKLPQDVWLYKDPQRPKYPTQKNERMLERIISTSSNPGDTVLDCYAGSGSTLLTAAQLGRRFIGMDNAPAAQGIIRHQLTNWKTEQCLWLDDATHVPQPCARK